MKAKQKIYAITNIIFFHPMYNLHARKQLKAATLLSINQNFLYQFVKCGFMDLNQVKTNILLQSAILLIYFINCILLLYSELRVKRSSTKDNIAKFKPIISIPNINNSQLLVDNDDRTCVDINSNKKREYSLLAVYLRKNYTVTELVIHGYTNESMFIHVSGTSFFNKNDKNFNINKYRICQKFKTFYKAFKKHISCPGLSVSYILIYFNSSFNVKLCDLRIYYANPFTFKPFLSYDQSILRAVNLKKLPAYQYDIYKNNGNKYGPIQALKGVGCTKTTKTSKSWWALDLKKKKHLGTLELRIKHPHNGLVVEVGDNLPDKRWPIIPNLRLCFFIKKDIKELKAKCERPLTGRYVILYPLFSDSIELCTLKVYELKDKHPCQNSPCLNGASCIQLKNKRYECFCKPGTEGKRCGKLTTKCNEDNQELVCSGRGYCDLAIRDKIVCSCNEGFAGERCEIKLHTCSSFPCLNGGTCIEYYNTFKCECKPDFSGSRCQKFMKDCQKRRVCLNGGSCFDGLKGPLCVCLNGFTGNKCEEDVNECASNPCKHGECIDEPNGFRCKCRSEWTGHKCNRLAKRKTTCKRSYNNRVNDSDCFAGVPSSRIPTVCSGVNCGSDAICIPWKWTYMCICTSRLSGSRCETSQNICTNYPCENGGSCSFISGSFNCKCPAGFYGELCQLPTATLPPGITLPPSQTLPSGWRFGPSIGPCIPNPCLNFGRCRLVNGIGRCFCPSNWRGDFCTEKSENCGSRPCMNEGICLWNNNSSNPSCLCKPDYTGEFCENGILHKCYSDSECSNGGRCESVNYQRRCVCASGWAGERCETVIDPCLSSPCWHGVCAKLPGTKASIVCDCYPGWTGEFCNISPDDPCHSYPCLNGGKCTTLNKDFNCLCQGDYTGKICNIRKSGLIEDNSLIVSNFRVRPCREHGCVCSQNPCLHRGICHETNPLDYECHCESSWYGKRCEHRVKGENRCLLSYKKAPCGHGFCKHDVEAYYCICPKAYKDRCCEKMTDPCASRPCPSDLKCVTLKKNYSTAFHCISYSFLDGSGPNFGEPGNYS